VPRGVDQRGDHSVMSLSFIGINSFALTAGTAKNKDQPLVVLAVRFGLGTGRAQ
jgi:hypothetical protein